MKGMMDANTIISLGDLSHIWTDLAQDEQSPGHYELTEHGEIVMSPKPTNRHQLLTTDIAFQLRMQLGGKAGVEVAVLTTTAGVRVPDVVWMPEDRWHVVTTADGLVQGPDLVVEVLSPGNPHPEMTHKIQGYLSSGVQEVIVVGLTGTIEYIRRDGVHATSMFNLPLSLPSQLFSELGS